MDIKWQPIFTAKTPTLFQWYIFEGEREKHFKDVLNLDVSYTSGKNVLDEISYDLNELILMEKRFSSEIESNPIFISNYIRTCYQKCNRLLSISKRLGKIKNLKYVKTIALSPLYQKYQKSVFEIMPFMTTPMIVDKILKKKLVILLEDKLAITDKAEQDVFLSKLIIPKKKNYFIKEQDNLLRIALKIQKNKCIDINSDIEKHLELYAWTSTNVYLGKLQTKQSIRKKLSEILRKNPNKILLKNKQDKKRTLETYNKAILSIKSYKDVEELVNLAREFLFLQTHKMEVLFLAHYYMYPFFEEICKRLKIKLEELIYLTGNEISNLLENNYKLDRKLIKERMDNVSIIKEHNKMMIFSGDDIKKVIKKTIRATTVKGSVACRGKVIGTAKLLFEEDDMVKINKGDIIVSPMTRPHFVPAMKKAVGIVTDFGGILCHAAIISREFGIPCIVGTNDATKIFSDGDLIELNAYEGIAKKISK